MKELDFLPEWYRANRQQKQCRYRQYILFGVVISLLISWSFLAGHSVGNLQAQARHIESTLEKAQKTIRQVQDIEMEIAQLNQQTEAISVLTPRTAISAVLGELSHHIDENIILSRVFVAQESLFDKDKQTSSSSAIRIAAPKSEPSSLLPEGPMGTRVVLTGIASGGEQVARLIDRLETSDYFKHVAPAFSRAKKIGDREVSEFEITCQVADYEVLGNN